MKFTVLTLFPEIINAYCSESIMKRAIEGNVFELETVNPRDFTLDKHKKVDDTPYGGGAGMVLMAQPYVDAWESVKKGENTVTIMLTPQGKPLDDSKVNFFSKFDHIITLCGHYEGFDERIREIIKPVEISIGDFVLTGGELPALCLIDAVSRKLEGTLGKMESAEEETFSNGLVEYPHYTKPRVYRGLEVPQVLLEGNHKLIAEYRHQKSIERTKAKRPDLWEKLCGASKDSTLQ